MSLERLSQRLFLDTLSRGGQAGRIASLLKIVDVVILSDANGGCSKGGQM